ncbi:hypothetical protein [Aquisediminimonas profunda]|uniref:hypothetical protein n=1 Tax=Aquisediminimonas profunda TaxID=1550733 RepID=UPI001C6264E5|nr:hypothetical protein [Aquisediminimonas profunda]
MTNPTPKADPVLWEGAVATYKTSLDAFMAHMAARPGRIPVKLGHEYYKAQNRMMKLAAPDLEGIYEKLHAIFFDDLDYDTPESQWKCMLMGDVRRLILESQS